MIESFKNQATKDLFNGVNTKQTRKLLPSKLLKIALRKLDLLDSVIRLEELLIPPSNQLEKLHGDRAGQYSIRINDKYRVCFMWDNAPTKVEIIDYH